MNTNVNDFDGQSKLKQRADRIGTKMATIRASLKRAREDWFDVADDILGARMDLPNNADFGRWWNAQEWAEEIGPRNRAACIILALNRERCLRLLSHSDRTSPETMLELVTVILKDASGESLCQWRDQSCEASQDSAGDPAPAVIVHNPAPEAQKEAASPVPTPEQNAPVRTGAPSLPAVSGKNPAVRRWGEVGARILGSFSDGKSRRSWTQLAEKRHGIEVAKFALSYFERAGIPIPTNATIKTPNARLVLPWLKSPFADEYNLMKALGFQKLKNHFEIIERACRPYFDTHGHDRSNTCFDLFRREYMRPAELARQAGIEALRERERKVVNVENHQAILVHGVELWPDGNLPDELRLEYDAARWAYFIWHEHDSFFRGDIRSRAAFWRNTQAAVNRLKFPAGAAVSHFWWRAGTAMRDHPEAHMKSFCQPSLNIK